METTPARRPPSRWQLVHRKVVGVLWGRLSGVCATIAMPRRIEAPIESLGIAESGGIALGSIVSAATAFAGGTLLSLRPPWAKTAIPTPRSSTANPRRNRAAEMKSQRYAPPNMPIAAIAVNSPTAGHGI